ncbi:TIM-barrel domain-containing protein [Cohnella cholangitidis]|uniref:DUF4968 domain-containing protein n=1 Tax=Cohnella cholangitidis TaxID=2598458 RepID=A0A7G5BYH2_9BACL|nr:TIM-barrel domain-containing protein [Cohnella cholangitidis]QMV42006.1 DUF4968 domain-containing protein [Cohnella cholangitidis]
MELPQSKKKSWALYGITLVIVALIILGGNALLSKDSAEDTEAAAPSSTARQTSEAAAKRVSDGEPFVVVKSEGDHLELKSGTTAIILDVIQSDAIRVRVNPNGAAEPDTEVIAFTEFDPAGATIDATGNLVRITTDRMEAAIDLNKRSLTVYDAKKKLLLEQPDLLNTLQDEIEFKHDEDDRFYGIGGYEASENSADGILLGTAEFVQGGKQGHPGAPLAWSSTGYGLLVDTINARFYNSKGIVSFTNTSKKSPQYFILVGSPADMMATVADISGKPPLFPKWSMGFMNSEWGIDEKELLQHVSTYREKQIPIDASRSISIGRRGAKTTTASSGGMRRSSRAELPDS